MTIESQQLKLVDRVWWRRYTTLRSIRRLSHASVSISINTHAHDRRIQRRRSLSVRSRAVPNLGSGLVRTRTFGSRLPGYILPREKSNPSLSQTTTTSARRLCTARSEGANSLVAGGSSEQNLLPGVKHIKHHILGFFSTAGNLQHQGSRIECTVSTPLGVGMMCGGCRYFNIRMQTLYPKSAKSPTNANFRDCVGQY